MQARKRIAIDMDETICDTLSRQIDWYNRDFKQSLTKDVLVNTKIRKYVPDEHKAVVASHPDHPDFFIDLVPFANAIEVITELHKHHDIFITTAAMEHPTSFAAKYEWLQKCLPFISPLNYVFCGDKSIVHADYLIDDSSRHFKYFKGEAILFAAPHNLAETGFKRVNDWLEVKTLFGV